FENSWQFERQHVQRSRALPPLSIRSVRFTPTRLRVLGVCLPSPSGSGDRYDPRRVCGPQGPPRDAPADTREKRLPIQSECLVEPGRRKLPCVADPRDALQIAWHYDKAGCWSQRVCSSLAERGSARTAGVTANRSTTRRPPH